MARNGPKKPSVFASWIERRRFRALSRHPRGEPQPKPPKVGLRERLAAKNRIRRARAEAPKRPSLFARLKARRSMKKSSTKLPKPERSLRERLAATVASPKANKIERPSMTERMKVRAEMRAEHRESGAPPSPKQKAPLFGGRTDKVFAAAVALGVVLIAAVWFVSRGPGPSTAGFSLFNPAPPDEEVTPSPIRTSFRPVPTPTPSPTRASVAVVETTASSQSSTSTTSVPQPTSPSPTKTRTRPPPSSLSPSCQPHCHSSPPPSSTSSCVDPPGPATCQAPAVTSTAGGVPEWFAAIGLLLLLGTATARFTHPAR